MTGVASPERAEEIKARLGQLARQVSADGHPLDNINASYEFSKLVLELDGREAYLENVERSVLNYLTDMTGGNAGEMARIVFILQADLMAKRCAERTRMDTTALARNALTEMMGAMK